MSTRHLPPMLRRRPLGPLGAAHQSMDRFHDRIRAGRWLRANDPGEAA